jgi:ketosteroid isomerase-like protein
MMRSIAVLLLTFVAGMTSSLAQEADTKAVVEIKGMLEKHDKAFNEQNLAAIMETFAPGPKTVVLGTGPGERWVGKEEIDAAYKEMFKDFDPGSMTATCTWKVGDVMGNLAWLMAMCQLTDYLKNVKREYGLNISAVLEKMDGKWYFRAMHFSNLTGGQ